MITRSNILTEYPKIAQNTLPEPLRKKEFDFIVQNLDIADEDEDIGKYIDTFIGKLNEVEKQKSKPKDKTTKAVEDIIFAATAAATNPDSPDVVVVQPKPRKGKATKTSKKAKAEPKPKPERKSKIINRKSKIDNEVTEIPVDVAMIKSYCNMHGKVKTKSQVYTFIKRLQKAITEKRIRKASEYAPHIEYMQTRLITFYYDMKSGTKTYEIPAAKLNELKAKCNMRWADHVVVIKQFINILNDTKTGLKDKATALLKKIEGSTFAVEAKGAIASITKSLKDYLLGKTDEPTINEMALQGLYGLAGLSGLGELPAVSKAIDKPIPASELVKMNFKTLPFSGKWKELIGEVTDPFYIMIWGDKGSGKSTLAIEYAKYLSTSFRKRILYVASEEGIGGILQGKFIRLNAGLQNIHTVSALPSNLVEYDCIFIDSVNTMNIKVEEVDRIKKTYPYLSIVLMFQSRRDGEFKGNNSFPHLVDCIIECSNSKASCPEKNRYGGKGTIDITFEDSQKTRSNIANVFSL